MSAAAPSGQAFGALSWPVFSGAGTEQPTRVAAAPRLVLLDNYDSFTFNLYHRLAEVGAVLRVVRNDATTPEAILATGPDALVISPGPCDPDRAGITLPLIAAAAGRCPVLGVCLGHQALGQAFGGQVVRAPRPVHGKTDRIHHDGTGVFAGLPSPLVATRYHSLVVDRPSLPPSLVMNAWTEDGLIMGFRHVGLPMHGVQFHPESIATETGHELLHNFLGLLSAGARA
ncbi:aminodeoxychorismate/anthranilate synthase component II [Dankookia rubra]|uniref:Aminodeoxychorismate/anthranilate synthase component II n=1 Tax=Dankookia rubra TaxID=1442381 RepID=A0A4R5Q846_9PROT|nr:aminodeoxychorismate/anthranilate synthase component II [Dankookia rubra]TDH58916.1 aminodeoxychorismate/anthranilate synthase component II [Dankookia rubra]